MQLGRVRDGEALAAFAEEVLWATGQFALPFLRAACAEPGAFEVLDARCDAALPSLVANRASRAQGQAYLRAVSVLAPPLAQLAEEVWRARWPGHVAPAVGAAVGLLGGSADEAAHLYLFTTGRGLISAGVRLGVVGPLEAQGLLARLASVSAAVLRRHRARDPREAAATSPIADLLQAHQDRLYSRLFQS